ncbi:hypothetical protein [Arenicella chitinivorans]|nr:hypothetical protein [Arenicella chitinivorans]
MATKIKLQLFENFKSTFGVGVFRSVHARIYGNLLMSALFLCMFMTV